MKAEYMTHSGDDLLVVNAARVSFDKQSEWEYKKYITEPDGFGLTYELTEEPSLSQADIKLITYLAKHNHWTPFAHPQITLRISAPVPIRTQCFKHKQGFVENEESRRYIKSTPEVYVPDMWRQAAENVKQGSSDVGISYVKIIDIEGNYSPIVDAYKTATDAAIQQYERMVAKGVCPEQARFILPQGCMVNWVWTGSLAAYARFYKQRTDPHAQKEVQMLAEKVGEIIEPLFPVSWKALNADVGSHR